jgi:DnaJ-class molecular chaperone
MAMRACGTCDGKGTFKGTKCQTCNGTGEVEAATKEERKQLGRKPKKRDPKRK